MLFSDEKLVGICDLTLDGESINDTACALDLSTGRMMVQAGPPDLPSLNARFRSNAEINNIRLQTPYGEAVCDKAEAPLISSTRGGGAWIGATALTRLFERENKHFPKVTFVFNAPLAFAWPNQSSEIILTPGFDTGGAFEIPEFGTFNGRKQTVSVLDAENVEEELLLSAVSLAIGAPVRILAKTFKGKLTLMLNTHRPELQARTLFLSHKGDGYRDRDMVREGIKGVVAHSLKYLRALDEPQRIMAMDATRVFLEGRANRVAIELKLLALVRFLEWFDRCKTFSKNGLVTRLGVSQKEAETIVSLRNSLVHAHSDLRQTLTDMAHRLRDVDSDTFTSLAGRHPHLEVLNYLYSVSGAALLKEIEFPGEADEYFPKGVA